MLVVGTRVSVLAQAARTEDSDEEIAMGMRELRRDVDSLEKMGRNARAMVVGEHSPETSCPSWERLYARAKENKA